MSIDAIALVRIPFNQIQKAHPNSSALDDASLLVTGAGFALDPDEISYVVRESIGDLLDQHTDSRGIYVFPDVAKPKSKTYDALIDELGEIGQWVPVVEKGYVPQSQMEPMPSGFEEQMAGIMSGIPGDLMEEMQEAMQSGDGNALIRIQEKLQKVLMAQGGLEQFQESLMSALGGVAGGFPPGMEMPEMPSEQDAPELWAQAQEQIEALRKNNPEMLEKLEKQLGGALPPTKK